MQLTATQWRLLVGWILVIYLWAMLFIYRHKIKQFFDAFGGIKLDKEGLQGKNLKAVLLWSVYAYQQSGYINTLSLWLDQRKMKTILEEYWDLPDAESTKNKLHELLHNDFYTLIPLVVQAVKSDNKEQLIAQQLNLDLNKEYEDEDEEYNEEEFAQRTKYYKIMGRSNTLLTTYGELKHDNIIDNYSDITKYGIRWRDLWRLSFMTRLAYDYGYLSEQEARTLLHACYESAKKDFTSRESFFKSYVIWRALRWGPNNNNSGIAGLSEELLTDDTSPIKWLPF